MKKSNLKNRTKASEFYGGKSELVVPSKSDPGFQISSNELCYIKNNSSTSQPRPKRRKVEINIVQSDEENDILDLYK